MRHLQYFQVLSRLVEQKSTFLRILHFVYWRRIWLRNYCQAAIRYIRNYSQAAIRYIRNYSQAAIRYIRNYSVLAKQIASMYLRLIKLSVVATIRILKLKLAKLFRVRNASKGVVVLSLAESISLAKGFDYWGFIDFLRFLKQRFLHQKKR